MGIFKVPSFEAVENNKEAFIDMFHLFYNNNDPITSQGLVQAHGDRFLTQTRPYSYSSQAEMDKIYSLNY